MARSSNPLWKQVRANVLKTTPIKKGIMVQARIAKAFKAAGGSYTTSGKGKVMKFATSIKISKARAKRKGKV